MINVRLIRLHTSHEHGTLGFLLIDSVPFCATIEPSARLNAVGESSIPAGQYICAPYTSERYPNVYEVLNVPGRSKILFHPGNIAKDTEGCIILGSHFSKLKGSRAVLNSGNTFKKFKEIIGNNDFQLTVKEVY